MHSPNYEPLGLGAGSRIADRYDIARKLGAGAMSAVYEVVDRSLNNSVVALKLFSPQLISDETSVKRFRNEVLISRKLTHTNIVRTFDFGEVRAGHYFMTMEYVRGLTLEQYIRSEPEGVKNFQKILRILTEILSGLDYAHEMGIIHRDIKPGNILLSDSGEIKIADFGLARQADFEANLTRVGDCVGTPHYMAPEQIQGTEIDQRIDLYAVGIIAYELVTGTVPFSEKTWLELANRIVNDPFPKVATRKNGIPEWFEAFIHKGTAKKPEKRFASAREMLELLTPHLSLGAEENLPNVLPHTQRFRARATHYRNQNAPRYLPRFNPYRFAAIALPISLLIFGVIVAATYTQKKAAVVAEGFKEKTTILNDFADTLHKLQQAVIFVHANKNQVDKYFDDQMKAEQSTAPVESGESKVDQSQPSVLSPTQ